MSYNTDFISYSNYKFNDMTLEYISQEKFTFTPRRHFL